MSRSIRNMVFQCFCDKDDLEPVRVNDTRRFLYCLYILGPFKLRRGFSQLAPFREVTYSSPVQPRRAPPDGERHKPLGNSSETKGIFPPRPVPPIMFLEETKP